jgi:hypothetical protein
MPLDLDNLDETDDRSTAYVIETLGADFDKVYQRLNQKFDTPDEHGDYPYDESDARELVRTLFAFLEGTSFAIRIWSAAQLIQENRITDFERAVLDESTIDLQDGEVLPKQMKISLEENMKFTFKLADRARHKTTSTLDTSQKWWSDLKKAIKVRDRLMHPKFPRDLDISPDELTLTFAVESGFRVLLATYQSAAH